jgi:hypothetical protein
MAIRRSADETLLPVVRNFPALHQTKRVFISVINSSKRNFSLFQHVSETTIVPGVPVSLPVRFVPLAVRLLPRQQGPQCRRLHRRRHRRPPRLQHVPGYGSVEDHRPGRQHEPADHESGLPQLQEPGGDSDHPVEHSAVGDALLLDLGQARRPRLVPKQHHPAPGPQLQRTIETEGTVLGRQQNQLVAERHVPLPAGAQGFVDPEEQDHGADAANFSRDRQAQSAEIERKQLEGTESGRFRRREGNYEFYWIFTIQRGF